MPTENVKSREISPNSSARTSDLNLYKKMTYGGDQDSRDTSSKAPGSYREAVQKSYENPSDIAEVKARARYEKTIKALDKELEVAQQMYTRETQGLEEKYDQAYLSLAKDASELRRDYHEARDNIEQELQTLDKKLLAANKDYENRAKAAASKSKGRSEELRKLKSVYAISHLEGRAKLLEKQNEIKNEFINLMDEMNSDFQKIVQEREQAKSAFTEKLESARNNIYERRTAAETEWEKDKSTMKIEEKYSQRPKDTKEILMEEWGNMEEIKETNVWDSQGVQDAYYHLKESRPGSTLWKERGENLVVRYQKEVQGTDPDRVSEDLGTIRTALKPEGAIYEEQQSEIRTIEAEFEAARLEAFKLQADL